MKALALLAVLAACAPECSLQEARSLWQAQGVDPPENVTVDWRWTWTVPCAGAEEPKKSTIGCYYDATKHIAVAERRDECVAVLAHELGHAMGGAHTQSPATGIMLPSVSEPGWRPYVTADDVNALPEEWQPNAEPRP